MATEPRFECATPSARGVAHSEYLWWLVRPWQFPHISAE